MNPIYVSDAFKIFGSEFLSDSIVEGYLVSKLMVRFSLASPSKNLFQQKTTEYFDQLLLNHQDLAQFKSNILMRTMWKLLTGKYLCSRSY